MKLQSERLSLGEITLKDIAFIHNMHTYKEVLEFGTLYIPTSITETEELLQPVFDDQKKEKRSKYNWVIRLKTSKEFIGEIGFNLKAKKYSAGEIYYGILPEHWGKGYTTEAVKAVINFGFDQLKLHRIDAGVATENHKSIRILEKVGMTREGRHRKILPIRGEWKDNFHYAILENDERTY